MISTKSYLTLQGGRISAYDGSNLTFDGITEYKFIDGSNIQIEWFKINTFVISIDQTYRYYFNDFCIKGASTNMQFVNGSVYVDFNKILVNVCTGDNLSTLGGLGELKTYYDTYIENDYNSIDYNLFACYSPDVYEDEITIKLTEKLVVPYVKDNLRDTNPYYDDTPFLKNPWVISSIVLLILFAIFFFLLFLIRK